MNRIAAILILFGLTMAMPADGHSRGKPRSRDGDYTLSIAGYFKGQGWGIIAGTKLNLQLNVVTADGAKGTLVAPNMTLTGNRFNGSGNFQGTSVTFSGRVDAPDVDLERSIKGVRLVSLVKTSNGRYAHVVGYIQALAAGDGPQDRSRGK
jgi:hypothetical protein